MNKPFLEQQNGVTVVVWKKDSKTGILCPKNSNGNYVHDDSILDIDFIEKTASVNATKLAAKNQAEADAEAAMSAASQQESDDLAAAKSVDIETAGVSELRPLIKYIAKKVGV
jgi:hypothetical protein